MNEAFLHYVWKYRLLVGNLVTTTGESVVVDYPGEYNTNAGPDFFNARIRIGNMQWVGNVEIHKLASDWNAHHHNKDKNYNNVVLHVVYENDKDIKAENGNALPTLELKPFVSENLWQRYRAIVLSPSPSAIPCANHLANVPDIHISTYMERMAAERLERKADMVKDLLAETKGSWEQTCYILFARYFGGTANGLPFEMMAKSIPLTLYSKVRASHFQVEALMFGQAGMLTDDFTDQYPLALKREYEYLQKAYSLVPIEGYLWKFFRIRPYSFPTLRISQFALFMSRARNLFSKLLETRDFNDILSYLDVEASEYWDTHYHFQKQSKRMHKTTGRTFATLLVINAWVPLLFQYGVQHGMEKYKELALQLLEQIDAEHNNITKLWAEAGRGAHNALQSQALLEIYNEYCKRKRCLQCNIGYKILNNK